MVFHWSLSDSKSPQVSRTVLSILAVLSNAVIWIVSTRPPNSNSSRTLNNPFVIFLKPPITIGTIVTFMFHSFFNSLARLRYLSFFVHSFCFILWSASTGKSTKLQLLLLLLLPLRLMVGRSGKVHYLAGIRFCWLSVGLEVRLRLSDPFLSQDRKKCVSHFPGCILGGAYIICSYVKI